jgi:DNA mismatch endonuclease (patch repair protein)
MRRVRQKGTDAELVVGETLRRLGISYRKNVKSLPGAPDFANKSRKWAVFVHGCFWHHHMGCVRATIPLRNRAFWIDKFHANRQRDAARSKALDQLGFQVVTIWECETTSGQVLEERLASLSESLRR